MHEIGIIEEQLLHCRRYHLDHFGAIREKPTYDGRASCYCRYCNPIIPETEEQKIKKHKLMVEALDKIEKDLIKILKKDFKELQI